jgi:hypothetical protein
MDTNNTTQLVSLNKWLRPVGVTSTTGWRWRKRGILRAVNIYGRLYLTQESIAEFHRRATAGEFTMEAKPGKPVDRRDGVTP